METRFGVKGTVCDGVFFTEDAIPGATRRRPLSVEISRQNANLGEVKRRLASAAKGIGTTTIQNFKYGQRAHRWWTHIFDLKWDSESWYGEGEAVVIHSEER